MMRRSPLSVGRLVPLLAAALPFALPAQAQDATSDDAARWERRAQNVTITRDDWGIPHVYGDTDADAVFGLMYAQAEDDFDRVETNYLGALGRLAEAEGESAIYRDLRMKLFHDPDSMRVLYEASPPWLRELMNAWADGLNYYLHTHPEVTPRVIRRFEPWMPLAFSEGSISNDITRLHGPELQAFYEEHDVTDVPEPVAPRFQEPDGSNGIAIAPQNTANGNALLLINPHTSFYFRTEVHVTSGEGLNAYGAATWGQFFIYQGFNERLGWAHTTSGADAIDEYLETVTKRDGRLYYRYGDEERPIATSTLRIPYRTESGGMAERTFTVYGTHRGPIVREQDGKWVSVALMRKPVEALSQSFGRMKARNLGSFMEVMALEANSSNNTIYADADGNIAYMPPQFIPRRDDRFDFSEPVDGSDPATDWNGLHALDETPHVQNPASGWIQNTNNWPYSVAGPQSPNRDDFPPYMDTFGENQRGIHATLLLQDKQDFTLQSLVAAAYDSYMPAFEQLIPALVAAFDQAPPSHPLNGSVGDQIALLRQWDYRWSMGSVATSLAVHWTDRLWERFGATAMQATGSAQDLVLHDYLATRTTADQKLEALAAVADRLEEDFGSWSTPWGEINRFQRLTGDIEQSFSDQAPSIPVGFTPGWTGSLATFRTRTPEGATKRYGVGGNTFVAVVEFGERVRARAIKAGGQSGDPASPHFDDQAERYATGDLRDVYFYRSDLEGHIEREYRPGRAGGTDTVDVAPPTGETRSDRGAGSQVRGAEAAQWTAEDLQRRAALIYVQHAAFSLTGAREAGVAAAEQGRRIGEIVARYKQRLTWHTSSNALLANALAKLIEPEYELDFGRAMFMLRSRYQRAARELARYGSSIEEYVDWLQSMHDAIGPVQGYAMTARLEGDWLVETYRDLPNRKDLESATDLPLYEPTAEELRRYEGVYTGTRVGDTAEVQYKMRVWQEDGRLWVSTWRTGVREPYGRHLVPVEEGVFIPGWYALEGSTEIQSGARIRFSPTNAGSAARVELEVSGEDGPVLWKLRRDVSRQR